MLRKKQPNPTHSSSSRSASTASVVQQIRNHIVQAGTLPASLDRESNPWYDECPRAPPSLMRQVERPERREAREAEEYSEGVENDDSFGPYGGTRTTTGTASSRSNSRTNNKVASPSGSHIPASMNCIVGNVAGASGSRSASHGQPPSAFESSTSTTTGPGPEATQLAVNVRGSKSPAGTGGAGSLFQPAPTPPQTPAPATSSSQPPTPRAGSKGVGMPQFASLLKRGHSVGVSRTVQDSEEVAFDGALSKSEVVERAGSSASAAGGAPGSARRSLRGRLGSFIGSRMPSRG